MFYAASMQHPIRQWCYSQNPPVRIGEFAKRVGVSRIHLGRLMRADGNFGMNIFDACERASNGELKALQLIAHFQKQRELRGALAAADA
jgi:hypothetical protein